MPSNWTYKLLPDLPHPPDWLLDSVDCTLRPEVNDIGGIGKRILKNWRGYSGIPARNVRRKFSDEYINWIKENITPDFADASLMYCPGDHEKTSCGAHTDGTRDYVLIYNILPGGPDAGLCFWQEHGQPLIRDRYTEVGDFNQLTLVDQVKGPYNVWYLVNGRILHSSEHLSSLRLNFQVSFNTSNPWFE